MIEITATIDELIAIQAELKNSIDTIVSQHGFYRQVKGKVVNVGTMGSGSRSRYRKRRVRVSFTFERVSRFRVRWGLAVIPKTEGVCDIYSVARQLALYCQLSDMETLFLQQLLEIALEALEDRAMWIPYRAIIDRVLFSCHPHVWQRKLLVEKGVYFRVKCLVVCVIDLDKVV